MPIERTSLGLAWIARLDAQSQENILNDLRKQKIKNWAAIEKDIRQAIASIEKKSYCHASWLPEISAISTTVSLPQGRFASLNFSSPAESNLNKVLEAYSVHLLELRDKIEAEIKQ